MSLTQEYLKDGVCNLSIDEAVQVHRKSFNSNCRALKLKSKRSDSPEKVAHSLVWCSTSYLAFITDETLYLSKSNFIAAM